MEAPSFNTCSEHEARIKISRLHDNEIGKQGLRKQIIREGTSWQTPLPGDEVHVLFSGRVLGGASLDSNRDKGVPFTFKLGQCEVIKGWDEGIRSMKKGERAIFAIPPDLAYGETGYPPLVLPDSILIYEIELLSWSSIRDISGHGEILKKITQEGVGWATPKHADEIYVKYEARHEDGTLILKSEDPIELSLVDDHSFPAISKAVKTMRRGEKAELVVNFSYGLNRLEVPIGSKLTIQLELVSWKSVVDIAGDKKVLKKIIENGQGFDRPNKGSLVKVRYTGRLEDGSVFQQKGSFEKPFEFIAAEDQVHEGLEKAILTMKKGERAIVTISADYPSNGHYVTVPKNSVLRYDVNLIEFTKEKPFWKMETCEKIEACEMIKHDGNVLFKSGKFQRASEKYDKGAKYIEYDHNFTDHEKVQATALRISCNLNNAACKLKLGDYNEASRLCTKVLEIDESNIKALYRRSQAYIKTSNFEKAESDIVKALAIDPNNREVRVEYKELKQVQTKYGKYEAKIFGTMLSKLG